MMNEKCLIYCYTYLPTQEKYIGYTNNLEKRKKEHLNEYRVNQRFHNLLRKHYEDFIIEILEDNIPMEQIEEKEKFYIKKYDTFKGKGFNLTEGGDGGFSYCQLYWQTNPEKFKEHIKKIQPLAVEAAKEWRKNNPELEEKRLINLHDKCAQWRKENPEDFKKNIKIGQEAAKEWRKNNPERFEEIRQKATDATKKKVKLINTGEIFESASEAGRIYNIPQSNISACCRGVRKSAGKDQQNNKLIWEYVDN